jgi:tetratricopeptide (TPR) repeat protein
MEFKRGQNVGDTLPLEKKDYIEAAENSTKAIRDYSKVIELDPKNGDGYFGLADSSYYRGLAYKKMGLPSPAFDDFYQAAILFSEIKWKTKSPLPPIVAECVNYMKEIDISSPLIKELRDKINKLK